MIAAYFAAAAAKLCEAFCETLSPVCTGLFLFYFIRPFLFAEANQHKAVAN